MSHRGCIAVAGATGQTGRRVVSRLLDRGYSVVALARTPAKARTLLGPRAEVVEGDVRQAETLMPLFAEADGAILCTGTRQFFGSNGGPWVDAVGTPNLVEAARNSGCGHLVLMSAFGLDRSAPALTAFSLALNRYFVWKAAAEQAVVNSGLPHTIVRPVELRNRAPRGALVANQVEPLSLLRTVSRDLVADVLVDCLSHPNLKNVTFEVCEARRGYTVDRGTAYEGLKPGGVTARSSPLFGGP